MADEIAFGIFCFVSLFAMVEPLGVLPVFISLTAGLKPQQQRTVARRACLIAFLTLIIFAISGEYILQFFSISVNSLKIVGGVIFFLIGYEMLQAKLSRITHDETEAEASEYGRDISLTPLGIPLISGPGAIASSIVLMDKANNFTKQVLVLVAISVVMVITLYLLIAARRVARFLGDGGNKVLLRLMGLITMVIAVEFFFSGLKPIVQDMIRPPANG